MFNNQYVLFFDDRYNENNFDTSKDLFFFHKEQKKIILKNICAYSKLEKDKWGIKIKDFKITDNIQGKKLNKLLSKDSKSILIHRNIIKKSNVYFISLCFIEIKIYNKDEYKILSKMNKLNDISIIEN